MRSGKRWFLIAVSALNQTVFALVLAATVTAADASTLLLNISLDTSKDFLFFPHADGSVEADSNPSFNPIVVSPGDRLLVQVSFAGSRAHLGDIAPNNNGSEAVTLSLMPFSSTLYASAQITVDLINPQGDLAAGPRIFSGVVGFSGGLNWQSSLNLTDSEVSISGVAYDFQFNSSFQPIVLDRALFGIYGGAIRFESVPEPPGPVSYTHLTLPTSDLV